MPLNLTPHPTLPVYKYVNEVYRMINMAYDDFNTSEWVSVILKT